MYEDFYGLKSKPFQLNPDHTFYFDSKQHRRAKAYLDYGVMRNEGFIVITGEVGAGKTTLLSGLLDRLNRSNVVVGQLVTTQLDAEDTLRMVGAAFGFNVKGVSKSELLITLEAFLISQASRGKRCLLIVDEAQNLTARAVEELRMLSNYQLGTQSLLQSFLVGQPEFREILQRPEMKQFRQRVAASCHIGPLDTEDTQHYIEHRLKCAGATDTPTFDPATFEAVFNASQGIPRRINTLCDRLLLTGYLAGKTHLTAQDVSEVEEEFARETGSHAEGVVAPLGPVNGSAVHHVNGIDAAATGAGAGNAESYARELAGLAAQQQGGNLQRLEQSLLRLESINLKTLELLQRMLAPASAERPEAKE